MRNETPEQLATEVYGQRVCQCKWAKQIAYEHPTVETFKIHGLPNRPVWKKHTSIILGT